MPVDYSTAVESPGSKAIKVSGDRQTGVIVKRVNYNPENPNTWESQIPDLGDEHPYRDGLYFFDADIKPVSGGFADLILNYSWRRSGSVESQLRNETIDVPLNTHTEYLLRWDHYLIGKAGVTDIPTWWREASSIQEVLTEPDFNNYKLSTTLSLANGEVLLDSRVKPKNTYSRVKKSVIEKYYHSDLSKVQKPTELAGQRFFPQQTFGIGNRQRTDQWLVRSAPLTRDMGFWVVTMVFEYSHDKYNLDVSDENYFGWDADIYELGTV